MWTITSWQWTFNFILIEERKKTIVSNKKIKKNVLEQ